MGQSVGCAVVHTAVNRGVAHGFIHELCHRSTAGVGGIGQS